MASATPTLSDIRVAYQWIHMGDLNVCPICRELATYPFEEAEMGDQLVHPTYGAVWDLVANRSLVHTRYGMLGECRCELDVTVQVLIGGVYVDLFEARRQLEEYMARMEEAEVRTAALGLGVGTGRGRARPSEIGGYGSLMGFRRATAITGQLARGHITPRGMLSLGYLATDIPPGLLPSQLATILSRLGPVLPYAAVALYAGQMFYGVLERMVDEAQRPIRASEAYRERLTARERERAWNRYKTPLSGGAR